MVCRRLVVMRRNVPNEDLVFSMHHITIHILLRFWYKTMPTTAIQVSFVTGLLLVIYHHGIYL